MHGAGALQTGHRGANVEGLAGLDGHVVLAAVDYLRDDGFVAQIDVLEFRAETDMDHLCSGDKKRIWGLRRGDFGA